MNQGYFYDHEKMSDNYQEMMLCRGPDSNIAKKIKSPEKSPKYHK